MNLKDKYTKDKEETDKTFIITKHDILKALVL
jgi:hypothetical protein